MKYRILFFLTMVLCPAGASFLSAQTLAWDYQDMFSDLQQSGANPDMVSDGNGNIYVSYWDNLSQRLGYAYRDKNTHTWTISYPDPQTTGGYKSAIALDASNKVHIAYYKNVNGYGFLQYVTNKSGSWVATSVNDTIQLGKYGANTTPKEGFQPSVDIEIQPGGNPFITCFDGSFQSNAANPASCQYINYNLDILYAYKSGNNWVTGRLPNIESKVPGYCQTQGDRYGEFLKIIPASSGGFHVFTNSFFNRNLLVFRSNGNDLNEWSYAAVDSIDRDPANPITILSGFEAYEDISVGLFPGTDSVAMMYGFSDLYGLGSQATQARFYFSRIKHEALGTPSYSAFYKKMNATQNSKRCSKFAIAPHSSTDIYFSYYEEQNGRVIVGKTLFAGVGFVYDTVATDFFTNTKINLYKDNDSLFVLLYDAIKNRIVMAGKSLNSITNPNIPWVWEEATRSEITGDELKARSVPNTNGDILHITYTEKTDGNIFYGNRTSGGTWTYSQVNTPGTPANQPVVAVNNNTSPYIVYVEKGTNQLMGAKKSGNNWIAEAITGAPPAGEPALAIANNTIFVAFQNKSTEALMLATAPWGTTNWTVSLVDSAAAKTGRNPDIQVESDGSIHIAYLNETDRQVMYASKPASGTWSKQAITGVQEYDPVSISLQVNSTGDPFVGFYALETAKAYLSETDGNGNWTTSLVTDFGGNNLQGNPLKLRIDADDRLWMLYNYPTATSYELRLKRREYGTGIWYPVSVVNNQGEIGNSFDFNLAGNDFYIFGKKNLTGTSGIAYMYAENGASTDISYETLEKNYSFSAFPNPATSEITFSFSNPVMQDIRYAVMNLTGQILYTAEKQAAQPGIISFDYDCSALPSGFYFCKWEINGRTFVNKWVK
ncbi:MAG: T9SS type A sorting domain-containing protein [Bacteroidia bacterium]|nr:T9SS type A sorting domain-containing protein [Bacteroidia bacterium]